jgi:hypothetical protein
MELNLSICRRRGIPASEQVQGQIDGDGVRATVTMTTGQVGGVILESPRTS